MRKQTCPMVANGAVSSREPPYFASFASLAENKFKLPDYSGSKGKVVSINEATNPAIFNVFCVLSG